MRPSKHIGQQAIAKKNRQMLTALLAGNNFQITFKI